MNSPFADLTNFQKNKLFDLLGVHIYKFKKNQEILPTIRKDNIIGIILSGYAQIINIEYNGNEIIIEKLKENSVFGSNISATNSDNFEIFAKEDTEVLVIDYENLLSPTNLKYNYFNIFLQNLFNITNLKLKEKNERLKILEKKQIRERLLEYFEIEYRKSYLKSILLPFTFRDLADYISVNRSAMFRELKNLKDERFIEVKGRKVTLLYK